MNYKKLYERMMNNIKSKNRVKYQGIYYEKHHIIPEFMFYNRKRKGPRGHLIGNPDSTENLILIKNLIQI